jgi:GT2 family glycosyltransferase
MKLTRQGWYTIYAAGAEAYHLEGESRGSDLSDAKWARRRAELSAFVERWGRTADPWMSIAVAKSSESGRFR